MEFIFTPDIYRNYCQASVAAYHRLLLKLSSQCPNSSVLLTKETPISQKEWCRLQGTTTIPIEQSNPSVIYCYFEIPENTRLFYIQNKIGYLNFMTPKYRFPGMEESIMVESNIPLSVNWYEKYQIPKKIELPEYHGKTVAIGQMDMDRSVIFSGFGYQLFDFDFKADIFRPHPHALIAQPEYSKNMELKAKQLGMEVRSDGDIYQIMQNCQKMVAISSSTLYEAQYCNTPVQFLNEKDYIKKGKLIKMKDINLDFWKMVWDNSKGVRK